MVSFRPFLELNLSAVSAEKVSGRRRGGLESPEPRARPESEKRVRSTQRLARDSKGTAEYACDNKCSCRHGTLQLREPAFSDLPWCLPCGSSGLSRRSEDNSIYTRH